MAIRFTTGARVDRRGFWTLSMGWRMYFPGELLLFSLVLRKYLTLPNATDREASLAGLL
jgi:hypothetical protein